jgi:hypothetical protein
MNLTCIPYTNAHEYNFQTCGFRQADNNKIIF